LIVERLELVDFRNYSSASFTLTAGTTVVVGDNGQGKTNLAEALAYLATLASFRGAPPDALVRVGAAAAVVRAELRDEDGRTSLIEAELVPAGRNRVQVNRQRLGRARDLLGVVRVSVFSPDDLTLVKGGPGDRRRFLDDTLVALAVKYDALRLELDRIVRQRNMLLRQAGGRLDEAAAVTLDVWDAKLAEVGDRFGYARATLVDRIRPFVTDAYANLAGLSIAGLPARTHASQGEQRTLALSLRLAAHRLVADRTGSTPVLVLDDVLSELDAGRATALLGSLPHGQVVITTAAAVPGAARPDRVMRVAAGRVVAADLPASTVVEVGAP
jgi:DNA replication and repair protein RecF